MLLLGNIARRDKTMKMRIRFDEIKALNTNHTIKDLYEKTDEICRNRGLIVKGLGEYEASGTVTTLFLATDDMEAAEGIVAAADEWFWWIQSDRDEDKENILEVIENWEKKGKGIRVTP